MKRAFALIPVLALVACQAFLTDAQKVDQELLKVDPIAEQIIICIDEGLASDPNIANVVADVDLIPDVVACVEQPDGGTSVSADTLAALIHRQRPQAVKRAAARKAKAHLVDAGAGG